MSKKRTLDSRIRSSQTFAELTYRQRDLWQGLIAVADDQGRLPGLSAYVRSKVWPFDDLPIAEVETDLQRLIELVMIHRYEVSGNIYIQIINWWKYQTPQWAGQSDYPAPEAWADRKRYHGTGHQVVTENWDQLGGFDQSNKLPPDLPPDLPGDKPPSGPDENQDLREEDIKDKADFINRGGGGVGAQSEPNVFAVYEREIGPLTPMISEKLKELEGEHISQWVIAAIKIASANNKRSLAYCTAILERWKADGYGSEFRSPQAHTPANKGNRTSSAPQESEIDRRLKEAQSGK